MFEVLSGVLLGVVGIVVINGTNATLKALQQRRNDRAERERQRVQAAHDLSITTKKIRDGKKAMDRAVNQDRVNINRSEKALGSLVNHYLGVRRRHQELVRDPQITKAVENGWLVWNSANRLEVNPGRVPRGSVEAQLYGEATSHVNRDLNRFEAMLGNMERQIFAETGIGHETLVSMHGQGALEHLPPRPRIPSLGNQWAELNADIGLPPVRMDAGQTAKRSLRERVRGAFGGGRRQGQQDNPAGREALPPPNQVPAPPPYPPAPPPPASWGPNHGPGPQQPTNPRPAFVPDQAVSPGRPPQPPHPAGQGAPPAIPPKPTYPPGQAGRPPSYPPQPSGPPGQSGPRQRTHPRQVPGGGNQPR